MRFIFAALVACAPVIGCGGDDRSDRPDAGDPSGGAECPDEFSPGDTCTLDPDVRCALVNEFSSCASAVCRCLSGRFSCAEELGAEDGEPCGGSPLASCAYEGTPTCETPPTARACQCDSDGTWHCLCACYGPSTTCGSCPDRYLPELEGLLCDPAIAECSFPEGTCICVELGDGSGNGSFECTSSTRSSADEFPRAKEASSAAKAGSAPGR